MHFRRFIFALLTCITMVVMVLVMARALSPGWPAGTPISPAAVVFLVLFAFTLPWTVVGFWNATIGFAVMVLSRNPAVVVFPGAGRALPDDPIAASTAILVCVRNEMPDRVARNLDLILQGLDSAGVGDRFHIYVLSDTNDADIAPAEQTRFEALAAAWRGRIALTYRRRESNEGFKAGNIEDFCARFGARHEFALPLDADSFMSAPAILRLVRIMQANPRVGILQGLVIAMPSTSAFTRIFQFGMRLGMRSYTIGSAWWQGDCGPYWGHNAILRLAPFARDCKLPLLRGRNGPVHIMSHDQVEAVLMRRAGFEVRVLADEDQSWEGNPPTLVEFVRRDLRWCEGNMQYLQLLGLPRILPTSRAQLALAILMFAGAPAWVGMLAWGVGMTAAARDASLLVDAAWATGIFWTVAVMLYLPKIASAVDVLLRFRSRRAFGGGLRFLTGFAIETAFSVLLCPIMWCSQSLFLVRLAMGRAAGWGAQARDDHTLSWRQATAHFWPHTTFGALLLGVLLFAAPAALPYAFFFLGGPLLAIPLAVVTSWPGVARALMRAHILSLPEELAPPPDLCALGLAALAPAGESGQRRRA